MKVRVFQGRTIESIPLEEKAIRLSPLDPFVDLWYRDLGDAYLLLGKDEEAVHWLEKAVATNDKVWTYHKELAAAYALTGRFFRRISSNETFLKQLDHYMAGLRLAGLPEN
jgi:adenylate cyclase